MSRLTANLFMNSFNENLECLKTVWFDNKSMPLDTFKAKCLGQILLTGPYKVYIKRTGTQVDKLNTCNMSVTSYTVTFK